MLRCENYQTTNNQRFNAINHGIKTNNIESNDINYERKN